MPEANRYQKRLLESYPNIDLLPLDQRDEVEVAKAVAERRTGDGLFEFLWHELAAMGEEDTCEVDKALGQALFDIETVRRDIFHTCSTPSADGPKA